MRLRYLSLCLLSLTIMGCTQHAIKTENTQPLLEQRAVQGLNSLYETSGYDFKGKLSVQTQPITLKRNDPQYQTLNHLSEANKKKIEDLLKQQNIHLNHAEKKHFLMPFYLNRIY